MKQIILSAFLIAAMASCSTRKCTTYKIQYTNDVDLLVYMPDAYNQVFFRNPGKRFPGDSIKICLDPNSGVLFTEDGGERIIILDR